MSFRFLVDPQPAGVEIRLIGPDGPLATDLWPVAVPDALLAGVDVAQRLVAAETAIADGDQLLATFTLDQELEKRFGTADRMILGTLEWKAGAGGK